MNESPIRTITVAVHPVKPTFSSAATAIAHAKSYGPLAAVKDAERKVLGCQISNALWSDTDFFIGFSNGRFLHVFVKSGDRNVQWRMLDQRPELADGEFERVGSPAVALQFPRADRSIMDCSAMINDRRGKDFKQFFVNEQGFCVYTRARRILCFHCVFREDTGENLLYVYEGK